jgi:hypothetical protein
MNEKDHIGVQYALNWSDRDNPNYNSQPISKIQLVCKNEMVFNYQKDFGINEAVYNPLTDEWVITIPINSSFREGQGIELRGYILALPTNFINSDTFNNSKARVDNLKAVKDGNPVFGGIGQVRGCSTKILENKGDWFFDNLQKVYENTEFPQKITHGNSIFGYKAVGPANNPGQTGAQEDFGADAGQTATVHNDCSWITYIEGAMTDHMRPFNIFDRNGFNINKNAHPNWVTWNMETFDILSTDTLGKTRHQARGDGTGMLAYDNQHRSWNNAFTFYALTGDNLVHDAMEKAVTVDLSQAKNFSLAEREVGRMLVWYYKAWAITTSPFQKYNLENLAIKLYRQVTEDWRGRFFKGFQNRVKVLQVVRDIRSGILDENGDAYYTWIPYQTAEMVKGLYALLFMVDDEALKDEVSSMIADLVTTIAKYGCFQEDGKFYPLTFCKYNVQNHNQPLPKNQPTSGEGFPLDPSAYFIGSQSIRVGEVEFWDWMAPAIEIGLNIDSKYFDSGTLELLSKISEYVYQGSTPLPYNIGKWLLTSIKEKS